MKVKKKNLYIFLFIFLSISILGIVNSSELFINCNEDVTSKECYNILNGEKTLEIYPERYYDGNNYVIPEYGLNNGLFRDYKGAIYDYNSQGFMNIYSLQNESLNSFAFAISGDIGGSNYVYSSLNFSWSWNINHNETSDEYTFIGYNNNPNFNWTQEFHFYPNKKMKIYHKLTNNLGQDIENTKFWYINKINEDSFIEWNNEIFNLNESINLNGNFNNIFPEINFGNMYIFEYSDLINDGFDISNIYVGDGGIIGYENINILGVGITKGSGNFLSGSSIIIDPSLEVTNGTTTILGGNQEYTTVLVHDNATLRVNETIGFLNITATDSITIYGTLDGEGESNYSGGTGGLGGISCTNGANGIFGEGNDGAQPGVGGESCGTSTANGGLLDADQVGNSTSRTDISQGYGAGGGGGGGTEGAAARASNGFDGDGGGAGIRLFAFNIFINGTVTAKGGDGGDGGDARVDGGCDNDGGGGGGGAAGSAGTIIIDGFNVNISNSILDVSHGIKGFGGDGVCTGGKTGNSGIDGNGGRLKIFYSSSAEFDETSTTKSLGNTGTSYTEQTSGDSFNIPPVLATNETIPTPDLNTQNIFFNITAYDPDNDSIEGVFFTLIQSNSTIIINSINGTWITGDSALGQNETWESTRFNITNLTSEVGQYNWSVTVQSNGSNANTTETDFFIIVDSENPSVNITSLESNQLWPQNLTIPINFTVSDNVEVDTCIYSLNNGTTNTTLTNCDNSIFSVIEGVYYYTQWVNDTSGNVNTTILSNITIIEDIIAPQNMTIINPVGTLSSKTFTTKIDVDDAGGISFCEYNITIGAGTEIVQTNLTFNSGTGFWEDSTIVSSDADYVINSICYDFGGFFNTTNGTFSVDTSVTPPSGGGGGGGSPQVVIINGTAQWSVETDQGGNIYEYRMIQGSSRSGGLVYMNLAASSPSITLTCEDNLCDYVEFEQEEFDLPVGLEIPTRVGFTIKLPDDLEKGDYITNLISTDDLNNRATITVRTSVGTFSLLISPFIKLTGSKGIIPYFVIFLFFAILFGSVSFLTFLKDSKFGLGLAILIGLFAGYIALLII